MLLSLQQYADIVEALRGNTSHEGSERRQHNRIDVQTKVTLALMNGGQIVRKFSAMTRDVSLGGMGLMQALSVDRNQQFLVLLPVEGGKQYLPVITKVVFCRPLADGLFGIGAEFQAVAGKDIAGEFAKLENAERERIQRQMLG